MSTSVSNELVIPYMHMCIHTWIHMHHYYTQSGETALHCAVKKEHEDVVDLLLKANVDKDLPEKVIYTDPSTTVM